MAQEREAITVILEEVILDEVGRQVYQRPTSRTFTKEKADVQELVEWLRANGYTQTHGEGLVSS